MLEILSFKMVIDFFARLAMYDITMDSAQAYLYRNDGSYSFYTFASVEELRSFYEERFSPFDECGESGGIWRLNMLTAHSGLDAYTMSFNVWDIGTGNWKMSVASQYDTGRNGVWKSGKERQTGLIDSTLAEYWGYHTELYAIYTRGVYSPCYAVPPWTEYTVTLQSYRGYFLQENAPAGNDPDIEIVIVEG